MKKIVILDYSTSRVTILNYPEEYDINSDGGEKFIQYLNDIGAVGRPQDCSWMIVSELELSISLG
jgi:hypothetical protein